MKLYHGIIFFTVLLALFVVAQKADGREIHAPSSPEFDHGVVVKKTTRGSEGEKAGFEKGDVLLTWSREDAKGEIESPFDLALLEVEQAQLGAVTIAGVRGGEKRTWSMGSNPWEIEAYPNFPKSLLASYLQGEELARAGKVAEATQRWQHVPAEDPSSVSPVTQVWLLVHAAETLAKAKQFKQSNDIYRESIHRAAGLRPAVRLVLLKLFARTLQDQSEWDSAAKYYQEALEISRESGVENLTTAASFDDLATLASYIGDFVKVEDYSRKALAIQEKLAPSSLALAITLNNLGLAAWRRGDLAAAENYHQKALAIRARINPGSLYVAESLNGLALIAYARHDLEKCAEYHRQALEIREKIQPGSKAVAASLNNLGTVNYARGDLAKAEAYFRQALAIKETLTPGSLDNVSTLGNLGVIAHLRGDLIKAEEYARQSLAIQEQQAPDSVEVSEGYSNLGLIMAERDDLEGAEEAYRRALAIQERLAPDAEGAANCFINLGELERRRGNLTKADEYCRRALMINEKLAPGGAGSATNLNCLGSVAFDAGDLQKAGQFLWQALAIRQKISPDSLDVAFTLADLAALAHKRGDLDEAETYGRQALVIEARLAPNTKSHAEGLATLAGIMRDKQQPEAAAKLFEQALTTLETQVTQLGGGTETRSEFRAREARYYKDYIDLLLERSRVDLAFQVLERLRARGLLETLNRAHPDMLNGVDKQLAEKERSLKESITIKSTELAETLNDSRSSEGQADGIHQEINRLLVEYQQVEARIREVSPGYASLTQPQPLTISAVRGLLDSNTLLLEYALGEERSYVFAVTLDSIVAFQIPKRSEIEGTAREVYKMIASPTMRNIQKRPSLPKAAALEKLSRMVLTPVAGLLNQKRLLVVSDGALQYIPFSILLSPEQPSLPLVMEHEIVSLPSASVLAVLRQQLLGHKPAPKAVAILADPVFDTHDDRLRSSPENNKPSAAASSAVNRQSGLERSWREVGMVRNGIFPRLPFTRREADAIYSIAQHAGASEALGFDASKATATDSDLRNYRILHIATHGLLNSSHPELSGLVLSLVDKQGRIQDGFLRLIDIYNLNLNADLVVLSACQTALGKQIAEEGLVGLTRGFMYAGSARVLASLWKVDDEATAELMKRFYTGVLKENLSPAQALRNAQIWMLRQKRWQSPYYWAGFVLQGEWR